MKKIHDDYCAECAIDFGDEDEVCEQTAFELSNNEHDWEEDGDEND